MLEIKEDYPKKTIFGGLTVVQGSWTMRGVA